LNVITNEPLVRTGATARNLIISSSGSIKKTKHSKGINDFFLLDIPVQNHIKSRRKNIHNDNVPK